MRLKRAPLTSAVDVEIVPPVTLSGLGTSGKWRVLLVNCATTPIADVESVVISSC